VKDWRFKLLYDGGCPFCLLEVRWLQRSNRHGHLAFEDVSSPEFVPSRYGATREELLGVIHGVFPDGRIVRKVEVFRQAYRAVGLGWLIAPTGWPVPPALDDLIDGAIASARRFAGAGITNFTVPINYYQLDTTALQHLLGALRSA